MIHPETETEESDEDRFTRIQRVKSVLVRKKFFGKIYLAVVVQFLILIAICLFCTLIPQIQSFFQKHDWTIYVFMGVFFAFLLLIAIWRRLRTTYPANLAALIVLTILNGLWVASMVAKFKLYIAIYALSANALIASILAVFAVCSPYDISSPMMIPLLVLSILVVLVPTFTIAYTITNQLQNFLLSILATVAGSVYFFLITRMVITSGDIFANEWVLAVLVIYTAIPHMLVYLIEMGTTGG